MTLPHKFMSPERERERERERVNRPPLTTQAKRIQSIYSIYVSQAFTPPCKHSNKSSFKHSSKQAFTLIELLVVIAVIAVLAVVLVLVLNPAELLKQARDSNRLSDLDTMNKALSIYSLEGGSLGNASLTYLSLIDTSATTTAGTDCTSLGFPGGSFHCPSSQSARNVDGTGWIPVNFKSVSSGSPIGTLPLDPVNTSSTHLFYSYFPGSGTFKLTSLPESQKYMNQAGQMSQLFQSGSNLYLGGGPNWVMVPANPTFGTQNFWVMKYEAKCLQGTTPLTSPDTGFHTYSNSTTPCTGSYAIASTPDGYPIANISHNTALSYCQSIGAHLLTNDEYMTIVRNAEQVSSNWSGGSPGSGYLYSGHNDNAPAYALTADANDANGYAGETNQGGNQRRTLTLSNGSVIWDMAGNVWQHVQRSVNNSGDLTTTMALPACSNGTLGWEWCEYSTNLPYVSAWSSDVAQAKVGPSNTSWNSSQGVGQVYTYGTGVNQGTSVFLRGGTWADGSDAGAFTLLLRWGAGDSLYNVGFRCAR